MKSLMFFVPMKPTGKARPRYSRVSKTMYTPSETAKAERLIAEYFRLSLHQSPIKDGFEVIKGHSVKALITAYHHVPPSLIRTKEGKRLVSQQICMRKPDADNVAKLVLDSLNGLAYHDDRQVTDLGIKRRWATEKPEGLEIVLNWSEE